MDCNNTQFVAIKENPPTPIGIVSMGKISQSVCNTRINSYFLEQQQRSAIFNNTNIVIDLMLRLLEKIPEITKESTQNQNSSILFNITCGFVIAASTVSLAKNIYNLWNKPSQRVHIRDCHDEKTQILINQTN